MLKICSILLVLAAVGTCFPEPPAGAEEKCLKEFGISHAELDDTFPLFTKKVDEKIDRKYKCYTKCLLKIFGLREENGIFDVAKFAQESRTPERKEMISNIANDCMITFEHEKDECEYSFKLLNCIIRNIDDKKKEEREKKEMERKKEQA